MFWVYESGTRFGLVSMDDGQVEGRMCKSGWLCFFFPRAMVLKYYPLLKKVKKKIDRRSL